MYTRFVLALTIALTILALSFNTRASDDQRSVVLNASARTSVASTHAVRLPTVVVRASAQDVLAADLSGRSSVRDLIRAEERIEKTGRALASNVGARVARVSMMIPYYAFGATRTRGAE